MSTSPSSSRTKTVPLDKIRPYWRNPRVIPDDAVEAVKSSIEEFGYVQPIVVDPDGIIVIGHTRYVALRRMGVTEVEVIEADLDDRQAKELRIIDNRSSEFSSWDYLKLTEEMENHSSKTLAALYPEGDPEDFADSGADMFTTTDPMSADSEVEFICPSCFHEWSQTVTRDAIFAGKVVAP